MTPETAVMLAKVLATSPQLWLNLQQTDDRYETFHDPTASEKLEDVKPLEGEG